MAHPSLLTSRVGEIRVPPRLGPVVLMPRRVPGGVLATLDALPDGALPRLAYEGPTAGLRRVMRAALAERLPRPRWLANWLLDDVLDQAALLTALTGAAALRVSLRAVAGPDDRPLATTEARCRLVTAYRGLGFDWLSPRAAAGLAAGRMADGRAPPTGVGAALRRLPRGDVAILRGDGGDGTGVAHRAAADVGPGAALLLLIDEVDRPPRAAPAFAAVRAETLQ